jgi:hypothetical protein
MSKPSIEQTGWNRSHRLCIAGPDERDPSLKAPMRQSAQMWELLEGAKTTAPPTWWTP